MIAGAITFGFILAAVLATQIKIDSKPIGDFIGMKTEGIIAYTDALQSA
jgi:hypothetical protein